MTQLTNTLKRTIHVYGIEGPVQVELDHTGLAFRIKGMRSTVNITWADVVRNCSTEQNVPSFLMSKPFELLKHMAEKVVARKAKK